MGYQPSICKNCLAYYVCKKKYAVNNECKHYSPIPPMPPVKPPKETSSVQKPGEQEKALYNIDRIITLLDFSAQLGASVTIAKEDVPILLEALEPVVKERYEYWQRLYARFKPLNIKKDVVKDT